MAQAWPARRLWQRRLSDPKQEQTSTMTARHEEVFAAGGISWLARPHLSLLFPWYVFCFVLLFYLSGFTGEARIQGDVPGAAVSRSTRRAYGESRG